MNTLKKLSSALAAFTLLATACSEKTSVIETLDEAAIFTFTANAGTDTRVSAEFGDTQNIINFKWKCSNFICKFNRKRRNG